MDIDELIDLQWDLNDAAPKALGAADDAKRPLSEIDCNVDPIAALNSDVKRQRVVRSNDDNEDDEELLALLQASQLEAKAPADVLQDDLGAQCSKPAANAAMGPPFSAGQQGSVLQEQHSTPAADGCTASIPDEPTGASSAEEPAAEASAAPAASVRSAPSHSGADNAPTASARAGPFRSAGDVDGPCISVTGADGARVYCGMQASTSGREHSARFVGHRGQLTRDSINILMEQVEKAAFERALLAGEPSQPSAAGRASDASQDQDGEHLWVDKYSPRLFLELLGDEEINREVVRWLKQWDRCVFGNTKGHPGGAKGRGRAKTGKQALDSRPEERILLICGAPGLGKTTLAHVVARHCGYRPLEINASDDRTATTLVSRINDAVQMQAVIGAARPNCVIIDEIDGAAGGAEGRSAISALLKLLSAGSRSRDDAENESPESTDAEAPGGRQNRKGGSGSNPLMRPLIAICNDLYAPALRPLRAVAKVVHFKKPSVDRICSRLKHICGAEGITVNRQALITLCDKTEQDLRSCLNTLQFLAKRKKLICSTDLAGLQCGQKDISKSAFQMWQHLFLDKGTAAAAGSSSAGKALDVQRYDAVADFGDHELVAAGLHENFHSARYLDTHMARTAGILGHLADGDCLTARMQRRSDYALLKFAPAHALSIRAIVAGPSRTPIEWPRAHGDAHRRSVIQKALLHSWLMDVNPAVYTALNPGTAVQEVLPTLLTVVGQHVRPVAPHLFTPAERGIMHRMTDLLLDHGATLALTGQDAVPVEGMPDVTLLSPPVHRLVLFKGIKRECKSLPLTVRQMVVQQVQLEAIKRREAMLGPVLEGPAAMEVEDASAAPALEASASQPAEQGSRRPVSGEKAFLLTVAQRAKEAAAAGAKKGGGKQKLSWLDALRHKSEQSKQRRKPEATPSQIAGGHAAPAVRYKFHEGYTNAVKRPLKIRDLL